jgi:hypothetical protein
LLDCFSFEGFQPHINPFIGQPTFIFAGGVPAPPTGIYILTEAPPGGISSLGPRWTGFG